MDEEIALDPPAVSTALTVSGQQFDLRAVPIPSPGDSTQLAVYEQIVGSQLEILLPERYEQIRQYLADDGYLSNEELAKILADARTTPEQIVAAAEPLTDRIATPGHKDLVHEFLAELNASVTDRPLQESLGTGGEYRVSMEQARENLAVYEQMIGTRLEIMIPAEYEHIQRALFDNRLLDNRELATALYEPTTSFRQMEQLVNRLVPFEDEPTRNELVSYLADLAATIRENNQLSKLDPTASYDVAAISQRQPGEEERVMTGFTLLIELPRQYEFLREAIGDSGLLDDRRVADGLADGNIFKIGNAIADLIAQLPEPQPGQPGRAELRDGLNSLFLLEGILPETGLTPAVRIAQDYSPTPAEPTKEGLIRGTGMELNLPERYEHLRPLLIERDVVNNRAFANDLFNPATSAETMKAVTQMLTINAPENVAADVKKMIGEIQDSVKRHAVGEKTELIPGNPVPVNKPASTIARFVEQPAVVPKQRKEKPVTEKKPGFMDVLKLKVMSGGMLANVIHNWELMSALVQSKLTASQNGQKLEPDQTNAVKQPTVAQGRPIQPVPTQNGPSVQSQAGPFEPKQSGTQQPAATQSKTSPEAEPGIPSTPASGIAKQPAQQPVSLPQSPGPTVQPGEKRPGIFRTIVNAVTSRGEKAGEHERVQEKQPINQTINQRKMEPTQKADRWDFAQVEKQLKEFGITRDLLKDSGNLDTLLNGRKTANVTINQTDKEGTMTPIKGALYITEVPGQGPQVFIQPERQEKKMPNFFLGHELTEKDKQNLSKNGDMGRVAELRDKVSGDLFKAYVGFDKNTNSLTVMRQDRFYMPSVVKGAPLDKKQQDSLKAGKPTLVKGMKGADGKPFDAYVQISAAKRSLKFMRPPEQTKKQAQGQKQSVDVKPVLAQTVKANGKAETKKATEPVGVKPPATGTAKKTAENKAGQKQPGVQEGTDVKTAIATVTKGGQSRTTVDKSQSSPASGPKTDAKQGSTPDVKQGKEQVVQTTNGQTTSQKAGPTNKNAPAPETVKAVKQAENKPKPKAPKIGR